MVERVGLRPPKDRGTLWRGVQEAVALGVTAYPCPEEAGTAENQIAGISQGSGADVYWQQVAIKCRGYPSTCPRACDWFPVPAEAEQAYRKLPRQNQGSNPGCPGFPEFTTKQLRNDGGSWVLGRGGCVYIRVPALDCPLFPFLTPSCLRAIPTPSNGLHK